MNKYADYIALATALSITIIPRAMIYKNTKNEGVENLNGIKKTKAKKSNSAVDKTDNSSSTTIPDINFKSALDLGE